MSDIEMMAINGLDEAVIGTGVRGDTEVLVYDATHVLEILEAIGYNEPSLDEFLEYIHINELGERAPIFVFLDSDVSSELARARAARQPPVH